MTRIARILTLTPPLSLDLRLVLATSRAGAMGCLDLAGAGSLQSPSIARVLRSLDARVSRVGFGLRLDSEQVLEWTRIPTLERLRVLICAGGRDRPWPRPRSIIQERPRPFGEVDSVEDAVEAVEAGFVDLVIAASERHEAAGGPTGLDVLLPIQEQLARRCRVWIRGNPAPRTARALRAAGAHGFVLDVIEGHGETSHRRLDLHTRFPTRSQEVASSPSRLTEGEASTSSPGNGRPEGSDARVPGARDTSIGSRPGHTGEPGAEDGMRGDLERTASVARIREQISDLVRPLSEDSDAPYPFREGSPLARFLGARFPIIHRVDGTGEDLPSQAAEVARRGGLPLLGLSFAPADPVIERLAAWSSGWCGGPWGVEWLPGGEAIDQGPFIRALLNARPRLVMGMAEGESTRILEAAGIAVYRPVRTADELVANFRLGGRRFVVGGAGCANPDPELSTLPFWEAVVDRLSRTLEPDARPEELHLLLGPGRCDARWAAAAAVVVAPLAKRGVEFGVVVEASSLREGGSGKVPAKKLATERNPLDLGTTGPSVPARGGVEASAVSSGQARDEALSTSESDPSLAIETNYDAIVVGGAKRDRSRTRRRQSRCRSTLRRPKPCDIAIVGMSAIVPGAGDLRQFWENTLNGVDSIVEVPPDRWNAALYYDRDPRTPDKIISRWGGFVPDIPFDPLAYGMPPTSLPSIEPLHLLTLEAVRAAIDDAGYTEKPFPRERTAVVLGAGGGAAQLAMGYAFRSYLPMLDTVAPGLGSLALDKARELLPEWTEDSFPGILLNVAAGRVANRFDLGGANFTVDAACGSSLAAASVAVRELESGAADMVILGGADTVQNPFTYLAFSKTHAFSPRGRCRPFDESADGIVISEAVAVVVLKRLADAERDGDRIYAVMKGLGASSDGRAKGLTAPRFEGQIRALGRAYEKAHVSPATVGYIEAHGTGTVAGDLAEVQALRQVFTEAGAEEKVCGLGSVKSLIGHTKCAAGLAGLINATLALYHRVYPPTIGIEQPSARGDFQGGPFHLSRHSRPWCLHDPSLPRRAGVSAFGFGGTNFHAVLESYEALRPAGCPGRLNWPAELFLWQASEPHQLSDRLTQLRRALLSSNPVALRDLARMNALERANEYQAAPSAAGTVRLAIVARTLSDLRAKIETTLRHIAEGSTALDDARDIALSRVESAPPKLAILFPGQGSQYPGMLEELAVAFPEILDTVDEADRILGERGRRPVGVRCFPPTPLDEHEAERQRQALAATDVAQPALGALSTGLLRLLRSLGVEADCHAGHSYGELVALHASGSFDFPALVALSEARGRFLLASCGDEPGGMAALATDVATTELLIDGCEGVVIANRNGPRQTVVAGPRVGIAQVLAAAQARRVHGQMLPVACGFHSPLVADARGPLARMAASLQPRPPSRPVISNLDGAAYPAQPEAIARRIGAHAVSPVDFIGTVESLHAAGCRVFLELGPGQVLTRLTQSILEQRGHLALSVDAPSRRGIVGLLDVLGRLFVSGVAIRPARLTEGRSTRVVSWDSGQFETDEPRPSATTWLVNGSRARPINAPEPPRLGTGPALARIEPTAETAPPHPAFGRSSPRPGPASDPGIAHAPAARNDAVFCAFQETMRKFLDVQRTALLQFLRSDTSRSPEVTPPGTSRAVLETTNLPDETVLSPRSEAVPTAFESSGLERDRIEHRLVELVRERTGYPAEMLLPDLDLEADLGVDSIKRIEILGSLRDELPHPFEGDESALMERLARARTMRAIVDCLAVPAPGNGAARDSLGDSTATSSAMILASSPGSPRDRTDSAPPTRMLIEAVDAPLTSPRAGLRPRATVVITEDRRGLARVLATRLQDEGHRVIRLIHDEASVDRAREETLGVDLTSPTSVSRIANTIRAHGPVAGLVHALPLYGGAGADLNPSDWSRRVGRETVGLFNLAREFADDLHIASRQGGAAALCLTGLGGGFASAGDMAPGWFPGQGALAGLVKTLAREWPAVRTRVVDLDPADALERLADRALRELLHADSRTEIGYLNGRRIALDVVEWPLDEGFATEFDLEPGAPVVLTGGARGITARVAADLARRWRPTLLLMGSTPESVGPEAVDTAGIDDSSTLKQIILERLRRVGSKPSPADVERAFLDLRRDREIRRNLDRLRRLGSEVIYARVDVRDRTAVERIVGAWRDRFGPPVGLIHGAGVIHDKLVRDKSLESFQRVLSTKLEGAVNLVHTLDASPPRFTVFFSSVAGRFGNVGQADYAAANDALNKLAVWLDQRWPGRVVSINWGPWSDIGMVSELEAHLGRRGLGMIHPDHGACRVALELIHGRKGEVEVVVAGELGTLVVPTEAKVAP